MALYLQILASPTSPEYFPRDTSQVISLRDGKRALLTWMSGLVSFTVMFCASARAAKEINARIMIVMVWVDWQVITYGSENSDWTPRR